MNTQLTQYQNIKIGDKIFTNGKDNHAFRKLNFQEIETVKETLTYQSCSNSMLTLITYESDNKTLGIIDRFLEVVN